MRNTERSSTQRHSKSGPKKKTAGAGYLFVLSLSELLSFYQMHRPMFTKTHKLPHLFLEDRYSLPERRSKPEGVCSTEKLRDLLTSARDSIKGMWTRNKQFGDLIAEVHGFLDRLTLFCDRRETHSLQVNKRRYDPAAEPSYDGEVFFPMFCMKHSSNHGGVNCALCQAKVFQLILIGDDFVLQSTQTHDAQDTALWVLHKK